VIVTNTALRAGALMSIEPAQRRFSILSSVPLELRHRICLEAIEFFGAVNNQKMHEALNKSWRNVVVPLSGWDFVMYLTKYTDIEATRYVEHIRQLCRRMAAAGILHEMGQSGPVVFAMTYHVFMELTEMERRGQCWLAKVLGPEFVYRLYSESAIVQITGQTAAGDEHAGTGIVLAPQWVMTCAHVVEDMTLHAEQSFCGQRVRVRRCVPHSVVDVALVEVDGNLKPLDGMTYRAPVVGEELYTLGFPRVPLAREAPVILQRGEVIVDQLRTVHGRTLFLYSAIARPGNSGGPIISAAGHVVGMVTEELSAQEGVAQLPFYAGIRSSDLAVAVAELGTGVALPTETYQ